MRNSTGGTSSSAKKKILSSAEKNAKKLVQARLPFKVIAPGSPPPIDGGSASKEENVAHSSSKSTNTVGKKESTDARKRKLSYESDSDVKAEAEADNVSKENVDTQAVVCSKKKKTNNPKEEVGEVISLLDDDEVDKRVSNIQSDGSTTSSSKNSKAVSKTPKAAEAKEKKIKGAGTPKTTGGQNSKASSGPKLTIKLPISGSKKNKRRKSKIGNFLESNSSYDVPQENNCCADSSDDIEEIASDFNPQKRTKLEFNEKETDAEDVSNENITKSITADTCTTEENKNEVSNKDTSDKKQDTESTSDNQESANIQNTCTISEECNQIEKFAPTGENCEQINNEELTKKHNESILIASDSSDDVEADEDADDETENKSSKHSNVSTENKKELKLKHKPLESVEHLDSESSHKNMTPKQKKLMQHRLLARQEKERKLLEEKKKKQQEKEEKEFAKKREREEKEDQKRKEREEKEEQRRKEREEKEEQRRKEREEKERKRLAEIEEKNEERRKKNEAKEEELKKKEEERKRKEIEKEEVELKKKKAAQAFTKFFVAKALPNNQQNIEDDENTGDGIKSLAFRPFQIKGDMKLAPLCRKVLSPEEKLQLEYLLGCYRQSGNVSNDQVQMNDQDLGKSKIMTNSKLYLEELKSGGIIPGKWRRLSTESKDDVILVEDELERVGQEIVEDIPAYIREEMRVKFYKFHDNRRPPYYGTFRKKSSTVSGRKPFVQDKKFFDYEVDSDDEWEEEEPGESLEDGSDEDKEKESEDEYEVDNEWFVPHGHLSDEELQNEDENGMGSENTREAQKVKLQIIQQEFAQEMKKKTEKIKPRLIGCIWPDLNGDRPQDCPNLIWETLGKRSMLYINPPMVEEPNPEELSSPVTSNADKLKPIVISDNMIKDLVRLVHGNNKSKNFIIREFMAYLEKTEESIKNGEFSNPAKSTIRDKIESFAEWQIVEQDAAANGNVSKKKKIKKRLCWVVNSEFLNKMEMSLNLENAWEYTLNPPQKVTKSEEAPETPSLNDVTTKTDDQVVEKAKLEKTQITKFTKVLTNEEKARELQTTPIALSYEQDTQGTTGKKSKPEKRLKSSPVTKQGEKERKRVPLLISVKRDQHILTPAKNKLISQFLQKDRVIKTPVSINASNNSSSSIVTDDDDVIALD